MVSQLEIKDGNIKLQEMSQQINKLVDEWQGKEMPAEVQTQVDGLLHTANEQRKSVERAYNAWELEKHVNEVDTSKRLAVTSDDGFGLQTKEYSIGDDMRRLNAALHGDTRQDPAGWLMGHKEMRHNAALRTAQEGRSLSREQAELKSFHYYLFGDDRPSNVANMQRWTGRDADSRVELNPEIKTALNEGTTTQGGFLTPDIYAQEIILPLANESWVRKAPRIRTINITSDNFRLPRMAYQSAAVLTTETTAYDEQEPTFTEQVFVPYKFTREVKASEEVLEDSRFDLWGELIQPDVTQAFAEAENSYLTIGTGSSQPEGVTINAPAGVTPTNGTGNVTTISTADHIINTYGALNFKYRANAAWMMHDTTYMIIRTLKDSQNRYLLADNNNNLMGPPVMTILGRPVIINSGMPVPAASAKTIVFGDFNYFVIADRVGITVKYAQELRAATGQVSWFIRKRFDSHMMLTAAFTRFTQSAS